MNSIAAVRRQPKLAGFTLVELLVVIAIIGVLVGMLVPAVQAAREAARRSGCTNNVRQICLATLHYESSNKRFPAGFEYDHRNPAQSSYGWNSNILPFLEMQNVYDILHAGNRDLSAAASSPEGLQALQTPIAIHRCPSEDGPSLNDADLMECYGYPTRHGLNNSAGAHIAVALSNYMGNASSHHIGSFGDHIPLYWPGYTTNEPNGIYWNNSRVTPQEITDGLSNTILIGERAWTLGGILGENYESRAGNAFGVASGNAAVLGKTAEAILSSGEGYINGTSWCDQPARGYSSHHPGGVLFGFTDGAVRFVSELIEADPFDSEHDDLVFENLLSRNDGNVRLEINQ
jgi:prepilin-type N-terminal cleavage/methylation domain-containing protein